MWRKIRCDGKFRKDFGFLGELKKAWVILLGGAEAKAATAPVLRPAVAHRYRREAGSGSGTKPDGVAEESKPTPAARAASGDRTGRGQRIEGETTGEG